MKKLICLFISLAAAYTSLAQTFKNEIGIQTDNDSYLGQGSDRYYTDGIYAYFRHSLKIKDGDTKLKNKILGFEAGQKIYNPQSGDVPSVLYVDRPYAGYLYAGSTLNLLYANESNLKLGAQVGIIGPGSGAAGVQTTVHSWLGFYPPTGWERQIHDGAQLNLSAQYNRLLGRDENVDATFNSYANLGNGFSGAGAGLMFRAGTINHLYNSISTQSTVSRAAAPHEFFAYYKPALNYVAYDATIQGSLLNKTVYPQQITLDKTPFIFSNQIGGAITANHFVFDVSVIFHTHEVTEMKQSEQWGSVSGFYRF